MPQITATLNYAETGAATNGTVSGSTLVVAESFFVNFAFAFSPMMAAPLQARSVTQMADAAATPAGTTTTAAMQPYRNAPNAAEDAMRPVATKPVIAYACAATGEGVYPRMLMLLMFFMVFMPTRGLVVRVRRF